MNRFAYYMSGYAFKAFSGFSKARITIHDKENIPEGSIIFTANHFTRIETVFLPYHIHNITKMPVWSLAAAELFQGSLKGILEAMGAVSTRDPQRDFMIVKSLLNREAECVIFPEGMMVKNKKIMSDDGFRTFEDGVIKRPHTGAAILALKTEFYRERLRRMKSINKAEYNRLLSVYEIKSPEDVLEKETFIVPVNITYYPVRAKENMLSRIAAKMMENPSGRVMDELMTEGTMVLSGVDVDIRFGTPISIRPYLFNSFVESDVSSRRRVEFSSRMSSHHAMKYGSMDIMQRYMKQVYQMTTLNYDHIFASILRYLPMDEEGIDPYDFRCRAYLATYACSMGFHCHFHASLYANQIHILTDDSFNRYEDFLQVALETGILEEKDGRLFRNESKYSFAPTFHAVRIENPVSVIANEVEPLSRVQALIREIVAYTPEEIHEQVKMKIIEKHRMAFDNDFSLFASPEKVRGSHLAKPFLLHSEQCHTGVLLVHDYLAVPGEMKALAHFLNDRGFSVYVPRLKGHGTSPEDLAGTSFHQWLDCAAEGFVLLHHLCDTVFAGGFGTGAMLALYLKKKASGLKALFAVAPPVRLKDFPQDFVGLPGIWGQMMKRAGLPGSTNEFSEYTPEAPHTRYSLNPIAGMKQIEQFLEVAEPELKNITVPVLVLQSRSNPVINPRGAEKIYKQIGSDVKEYFLFDIRRHGILNGEGARRVFRAIADFLEWNRRS